VREELFMAGTGGQGALLAGQVLTQAVLEKGLNVSWYPIYSPEVRGGTTSCAMVITDGHVGSPISGRPTTVILMDARSVQQHIERTAAGGVALVNASLAHEMPPVSDVRIVEVTGTDIAIGLGNERTTNMVMLGAYIGLRPVVTIEELARALEAVLPERHRRFLDLNIRGLQAGLETCQEATDDT